MIYQLIMPSDGQDVVAFSEYVRDHENGHFLQDPKWARVKSLWSWRGIEVYDEQGNRVGAMSVLLRKLPMGFSVAYAPRGPVCDRTNSEILKTIFQGMQALAKQQRCLLLYLDPDALNSDREFRGVMQNFGFHEQRSDAFGNVQPQSVFRLSLAGHTEDSLLDHFSQKTRYNIRLAQRRGVRVTRYPGNQPIPVNALVAFSELMQVTGERDGFLVRGRAYFQELLNCLGKDAVLYMASLDGIPIAGTIGIFYGSKAWYLYGASSNVYRNAMPNYLLQWNMLCDALRHGCSLFDFRGVPGTDAKEDPLHGLYRFKKGFRGEYTHFSGLFVFYHKPILGRIFHYLQSMLRKIRRKIRLSR